VIDAEAIEEPAEGAAPEGAAAAEARPLPDRRRGGSELDSWRGEVKAIAVVAAGGLAAGAATVAAISVAKRNGGRPKALRRRGNSRDNILASRSFLVDVHVLSR
jgi:hypothetical protein